jgi:hypothetical protein
MDWWRVVVAANAGANAGDIGAVDVDRDGGGTGCVVNAVYVTGRGETADIADVIVVAAQLVEIRVEQLLMLHALDDAHDAPGDMVVDTSELSGSPHHRDDRE